MANCKEFECDPENYTLYIHGYLLIWLHKQRQLGKLSHGKSIKLSVKINIVKNKEWESRGF